MKEDDMDETCSMHIRYEKWMQNFSRKTWKGWDHLGDVGVHGWIILK